MNMKQKIFNLLVLLLTAVTGAWASKDVVPSDQVLSDYYNQGDVCVCIYVPESTAPYGIVFTGSYNGWSTNASQCATFQAVTGYDGWYVTSFEPEAEPDGQKGMQGLPVRLDASGNVSMAYKAGAATVVRGGVQAEQGAYAGEINLINFGADAPNVIIIDQWNGELSAPTADGYTLSVGTNDHGTVKFYVGEAEVTKAAEGATVTVVITPATGWSVNKPNGQWIAAEAAARSSVPMLNGFELTKLLGADNSWSFVMERANAEVSVSYKKLLTNTDITVQDITALTYTGQAQEPVVTVKDGQTVLTLGTDYTVAYSNNTNAALATAAQNAPTVTITAVSTSEKYAGETTKTFTINPAKLTSVTLKQTEFMYNLFGPQDQSAEIDVVKAGELTVPAAQYDVEGNTAKAIGTYTVTVTGKTNFTGSVTTDFEIKDTKVDGNAEETESGEEVDDVTMTISVVDANEQTLSIDNISEGTPSTEGITVEIPAQINGWNVVSISSGAMDNLTNVTDIIMPDTDEPIEIEAGAFPALATIHTTLAMLDDYALMASLKDNYEGAKVVCTVTPENKYWTLGTGCDVIIPDDIDVYTVQVKNTAEVATEIVPEDQLKYNNERIIKANNGVLLLGTAGQSYDLVAYSGRIASGMPIAKSDNKDYGQKNCLEPVIEKKHYDSGHYFVLQNNEFHSILPEGDEVKVPAGKAVLHLGNDQAGADARVLKIDAEATGVNEVIEVNGVNDGSFYDLSGRKVNAPTKKGVYILNGKKVVVK